MALLTKESLYERVKSASGLWRENEIRNFAAGKLISERKIAFNAIVSYDIFLSHSSEDAIYIKALRDELVDAGFSVYVDWIDDPLLNRSRVTKHTASTLRLRMNSCRSILYVTSSAASKSVWMPWELGYMDARTNARVAIVPIVESSKKDDDYKGREYLGLYPYLDKTASAFYLHESARRWVAFEDWLAGFNPQIH